MLVNWFYSERDRLSTLFVCSYWIGICKDSEHYSIMGVFLLLLLLLVLDESMDCCILLSPNCRHTL